MMRPMPRSLGTLVLALLLGLMVAPLPAQPDRPTTASEPSAPERRFKVYKIELREAIVTQDVPFFIHRAVVAAQAEQADAVILDIDTPGGRVDLMGRIRDDLIRLEMPTISFVNNEAISAGSMLAIAMDKIVMAPISSIGGAQVISGTGQEIPEKVERKITSILRSEVRATAKHKGYPVRICEAWVDSEIEIPGLTPKGEVLTMDQEQATGVMGLADLDDPASSRTVAAYIAPSIEAILEREGLWPANVIEYEMTWSEKLARFLLHYKVFLLMIGLGAMFVEMKAPGLGVPGAIGLICLGLFFWGSYLADLANYIEVVLFVLGICLVLVEIFVIPGFGVAGAGGIVLIFSSLVMAMFKLPAPDLPDTAFNSMALRRALWNVVLVFVGFFPLAWVLAKIFPAMPGYSHLVLRPGTEDKDLKKIEPIGEGSLHVQQPLKGRELLGKEGVAVTDLRPGGTALIEGRRVDVVTDGAFLSKGDHVRVVNIDGPENMVTLVPRDDKE